MEAKTEVKSNTESLQGKKESDEEKAKPWNLWKKEQVFPTIGLCLGAAALVMNVKAVGPSLLDLQIRTSSTIEQVSLFISAKAFGGIFGGLVLGQFIERRSRWIQMSIFVMVEAIIFSATPWLTNFWAELVMFALHGFATHYAYTAGQLTSYSLWQDAKDSVFWMNIYQFAGTIGGMLGPIMVKPFLLEMETNSSVSDSNSSEHNISTHIIDAGDTNIMFGFMIGGVVLFVIGMFYVALFIAFGGIYVEHRKKQTKSSNAKGGSSVLKGTILVLLCMYYIFQAYFMRTYNNYLLAFSVNHLGWSKSQGANLTTVYFAAGVVFKVLIIYLVRIVKTEILVFAGLILANIASIALVLFVDCHSSIIWVFTVVLTCGTTTVYAVMIAWTDKYVGIKGFIGVLYTIAGSVGEVVFSALIGYMFENVSYLSFVYLLVACTGICLVIMVILQCLGLKYVSHDVIVKTEQKETDPLLNKQ